MYPSKSGDLSGQERSEKDLEKLKQQLEDPVLMPLPDSGADGPLDWAHLVDAAKAFEGRFYYFMKVDFITFLQKWQLLVSGLQRAL